VAALAAAAPAAAQSPVAKPEKAITFSQIDLNEEVTCLAQNIYFEARSEPVDGMLAVGHVVLNRVASKKFPDTVCKVVRQGGARRRHRCQFSWWCDGRSDEPHNKVAWNASRLIAWFIYNGQTDDPTGGALWYHADYVKPSWREAFVAGPRIGRHIFYLKSDDKLNGDRKRHS
jgi:spore germination cell wall hydrolase CwlJ-like protein